VPWRITFTPWPDERQIRNQENFDAAETELKKALELDPHLGNATCN